LAGGTNDSCPTDRVERQDGPAQSELPPLQGTGGRSSGGQRQSVAIARAIHFDAKVLIMDEPTAALGPAETAQVGKIIKQLKSEGLGIFLISHDIHDVFDLADWVTVMKNGQVVGTGRVEDMTKDEAWHDHPRQVSARRDSRAGRDGELTWAVLRLELNVSPLCVAGRWCGFEGWNFSLLSEGGPGANRRAMLPEAVSSSFKIKG
jgi:hypothetical protein